MFSISVEPVKKLDPMGSADIKRESFMVNFDQL